MIQSAMMESSRHKRKADFSTEQRGRLTKKRKVGHFVQSVFQDVAFSLQSTPHFNCINNGYYEGAAWGHFYITENIGTLDELIQQLRKFHIPMQMKTFLKLNSLRISPTLSSIIPRGTIIYLGMNFTTIHDWPKFVAADLITPYRQNSAMQHEFASPVGEAKNLRHGWAARESSSDPESQFWNLSNWDIQRTWFPHTKNFENVRKQIDWIRSQLVLDSGSYSPARNELPINVKREETPANRYQGFTLKPKRATSIGASDLADQGIYWNSDAKQWEVNREINGIRVYGGLFQTEKAAVAKSKELHRQYKNIPVPQVPSRSTSNPPAKPTHPISSRCNIILSQHDTLEDVRFQNGEPEYLVSTSAGCVWKSEEDVKFLRSFPEFQSMVNIFLDKFSYF